jgi:uncharacterized protein YkwD
VPSFLAWLLSLLRRPPEPPPSPPAVGSLLDAINAERSKYNLPPLGNSECLRVAADSWAEEMERTGRLSHNGFLERLAKCDFLNGSENVAAGQTTAAQCVASWMASLGHRRNMLGQWRWCGAGRSGNYWCALFA